VSRVKVLAGSFEPTDGIWYKGKFLLWAPGTQASKLSVSTPNTKVRASDLRTVEIATEDNVRRASGTAGWAAAGALALGPVGLLGGLLIGGRGKDITFVAEFRDGRKLLATVDAGTYKKILAAKGF
jgi:hypothetical protein